MIKLSELTRLIEQRSPNIRKWTAQGFDFMTCVAAEVLEKEPSGVTTNERYAIKTLAYPILYGRKVRG